MGAFPSRARLGRRPCAAGVGHARVGDSLRRRLGGHTQDTRSAHEHGFTHNTHIAPCNSCRFPSCIPPHAPPPGRHYLLGKCAQRRPRSSSTPWTY
ncbi:hypothetical protein HYPSUDRAFT_296355 [Hypholoma sublateritium FD-334 SS-4]|uniref:Uncharacterized protein n=1 Tax=Hypholoma sublateritium (strain FD-334 SS-4) TaxID=945553 RepID=A0A0D2LZG5_HYPSF|nr:hypothetical protein HYPSUDRAFT_296355 [Hypholoma sublateritium FD-334 SS-4]